MQRICVDMPIKQLRHRVTAAVFLVELIFMAGIYVWWFMPRPNLAIPDDVLPAETPVDKVVDWYSTTCSQHKFPFFNTQHSISLPLCACMPDSLVGRMDVSSVMERAVSPTGAPAQYDGVDSGGMWRPPYCTARQKVVIIVPFRDRETQLAIFLHHMHGILRRQQLDYRIIVAEQLSPDTFNKAALMNAAFVEARKLGTCDCVVFHDVDMLAEDDRNMYTCLQQPRHIGSHVDIFQYKVPYGGLIGGAMAFTPAQFEQINGFSNEFWGWGGEDDDLNKRLQAQNISVLRFPGSVARYTMIKHGEDKRNPRNPRAETAWEYKPLHYRRDGVNSVKYSRVRMELRPLYTWLHISLAPPPSSAPHHLAPSSVSLLLLALAACISARLCSCL